MDLAARQLRSKSRRVAGGIGHSAEGSGADRSPDPGNCYAKYYRSVAWDPVVPLLAPHRDVIAVDLLPGCGHVPMSDDPGLVAKVLLEGSA